MSSPIRHLIPVRLTLWLAEHGGFWMDAWYVKGSRCGNVLIGPRGKVWVHATSHTTRCFTHEGTYFTLMAFGHFFGDWT